MKLDKKIMKISKIDRLSLIKEAIEKESDIKEIEKLLE